MSQVSKINALDLADKLAIDMKNFIKLANDNQYDEKEISSILVDGVQRLFEGFNKSKNSFKMDQQISAITLTNVLMKFSEEMIDVEKIKLNKTEFNQTIIDVKQILIKILDNQHENMIKGVKAIFVEIDFLSKEHVLEGILKTKSARNFYKTMTSYIEELVDIIASQRDLNFNTEKKWDAYITKLSLNKKDITDSIQIINDYKDFYKEVQIYAISAVDKNQDKSKTNNSDKITKIDQRAQKKEESRSI